MEPRPPASSPLGVAANTTFDMLALAAGVDNLKFVC